MLWHAQHYAQQDYAQQHYDEQDTQQDHGDNGQGAAQYYYNYYKFSAG